MTREPEEQHLQEEAAEALLRRIDASDPWEALGEGTEEDPSFDLELRELLEAWAALPLSLEEQLPAAATRERLLAKVRDLGEANETEAGTIRGPRPLADSPRSSPASSRRESRSRWLLPLAATLMLGLVGVSGWLWTRLDEQTRTIAELERRIAELSRMVPAAVLESRLDAMEAQLRVVSNPGVGVCPLRPMQADVASASGLLYIAPDHKHWYLALAGLEPATGGRSYHLWFYVDGVPVSAGAFHPEPDEIVRLGSDTMPEGAKGVAITLEPRPDIERPTSEPLLFGDEILQMT